MLDHITAKFILVALFGVLSNLFKGRVRSILCILFAVLTFVFALNIGLVSFMAMDQVEDSFSGAFALDEVLTFKIGSFSLNFGFDLTSIVFSSLVSMLWGVAALYSYSYLKTNYPEKNDRVFQFCYSLCVFWAILFSLARDVITMFVVYELLTLSTIPLVGFKKNEETKAGLFTYLTVLFGCSLLFLLPATLFVFAKTGSVLFTGSGFIGNFGLSDAVLKLLLLCFLLGIGKAAFFPFHIWLPSAMVAPTPVSGLLHAVAVVKVGAFFVLRVMVDVFGMELLKSLLSSFNFPMYIACITMLFAGFAALFQGNLKKRLAYSTIGQISYVVLSLSTFTKLGVFTAMFQIVSHAVSKILLFFSVGAFYTSSHSNNIVDFAGIARKNRIAGLAFAFASLSLCGTPFTVGFLNKGFLFYNLVDSQNYVGLTVLAISAFLCFIYLVHVCYSLFNKSSARRIKKYDKIPLTFNFVFCVLFLINVLIFLIGIFFFLNYVNGG